MSAVALIKFIQDSVVGVGGWAFLGTVAGGIVTVENTDNTDVARWTITLVYAPPDSALVPGVLATAISNTPSASFTPDVEGPYRIQLDVEDGAAILDVDIRCFVIAFPGKGIIAPPYQRLPEQLPVLGSGLPGEKPDEMNIGGQPFGWSGDEDPSRVLMHQALRILDATEGLPDLASASEGDVLAVSDDLANEPFVTRSGYDPVTALRETDVWAVHSNLSGAGIPSLRRYNAQDDSLMERVLVGTSGDSMLDVAWDWTNDSLWAVLREESSKDLLIRQVSPAPPHVGTMVGSPNAVSSGAGAVTIVFDGIYLWALDEGSAHRIDPASPAGPYSTVSFGSTDMSDAVLDPNQARYSGSPDTTGKRVFFSDMANRKIHRVSSNFPTVIEADVDLDGEPVGLAISLSWLWTAANVDGVSTLFRIQPAQFGASIIVNATNPDLDTAVPGLVTGFSRKSLVFDGVDEHVLVGDVTALKFTDATAFSITAWFRSSSATDQDIVNKRVDAIPSTGYYLRLTASGSLLWEIRGTSDPQAAGVQTVSSAFADGEWHHVLVTYDGSSAASGLAVYVDGVAEPATSVNDTLATTIDTTEPFKIGIADTAANPFDGNVDDVAVWDIELSAGQVTTVYNEGSPPDLRLTGPSTDLVGYWTMGDGDAFPTLRDRQVATATTAAGGVPDRSANSNDGTATNMEDGDFQSDTPGGTSGFSSLFDGVNEYVSIGDVAPLKFAHNSAFSVSLWLKSSSATDQTLFSKYDGSSGYRIRLTAAGQVFMALTNTGGGTDEVEVTTNTGGGLGDGAWHHLLVTWDGATTQAAANLTVYVDGAVRAFATASDTLSATIDNAAAAQVSGENGTTNTVNGRVDDVAVWDKELDSDEAGEVYNSGALLDVTLLATYSNLVGYWLMGEDANDGAMTNMESGDIVADAPLTGGNLFSVAYDSVNDKVWVYGENGAGNPVAVRLDPTTMLVEASLVLNTLGSADTPNAPDPRVSAFGGSVWANTMVDGNSYKIEPVAPAATALVTTYRFAAFGPPVGASILEAQVFS